MFRLAVTASPWDQGDLWPLRNGQALETKTDAFCAGQRENICWGWGHGEKRGGLTLRDSSFGLWWEVADGSTQKVTVDVASLRPKSPLFYPLMPPAATRLSGKNWLKKADKYNMRENFLDMNATVFLITSPQEPLVTASLSFFDWIWAWINDLRGLHITGPVEKIHLNNSGFDIIVHCHDKWASEFFNPNEAVQYDLNSAELERR